MTDKFHILIYHQVLDQSDSLRPFEVDIKTFRAQIGVLSSLFTILPLSEAVKRSRDRSLRHGTVCITFDDGYADNFRNAMPILRSYEASATFFVAAAYSDGGFMFNDFVIEAVRACRKSHVCLDGIPERIYIGDTQASRLSAIREILGKIKYLPYDRRQELAEALARQCNPDMSRSLMMTGDEVRRLKRSGFEIGAHTMTHPILSKVSDSRSLSEIRDSKRVLEELTQSSISTFAYPNGRPGVDYGERDVNFVKSCGFQFAVSTDWNGACSRSRDLELPRVSIGIQTGIRLFAKTALHRF